MSALGPCRPLSGPLPGHVILDPLSRAPWGVPAPRVHRGAHTESQVQVEKEEGVFPEPESLGAAPVLDIGRIVQEVSCPALRRDVLLNLLELPSPSL